MVDRIECLLPSVDRGAIDQECCLRFIGRQVQRPYAMQQAGVTFAASLCVSRLTMRNGRVRLNTKRTFNFRRCATSDAAHGFVKPPYL